MRLPWGSAAIWLALLDCVAFVTAWVRNGLRTASGMPPSGWWQSVYLVSGIAGLVLAVYGFVVLVRGGMLRGGLKPLRQGALVVLFAMVPGCGGLMALLSHLGTHPV
ncbi:MAG: hypothetical protein K6T30_05945 [Alicyclobacillus sp.]|nr:hypothetical protein [Alicyclobacillus sp.]